MRQDLKLLRLGGSPLVSLLVLSCTLFFSPWALLAQQPTPRKAPIPKAPAKAATPVAPAAEQPPVKYKGIFEPVNIKEDLELNDVFFVSPEVGWVSGAGGTILKTTDGGANWTVQLGGDPQSRDHAITQLKFLDEQTGWARQRDKLLRTTDGETWELAGPISEHAYDFSFTSLTNGVYLGYGEQIFHTQDGGRTWKHTGTCQARAELAGLMRNLTCENNLLQFVSPTVGFVVGFSRDPSVTVVMKTEDEGATWTAAGVLENESSRRGGMFFLDENTGVLATYSGQEYRTTDGGQTWKPLLNARLGQQIRFADPEVGWSVERDNDAAAISFTTDGGLRWTTRMFRFPAIVWALSFPRRDVGYVAGQHGLVYRYSVVSADYMNPKGIDAPAMPGFDSPLDEQVEQLSEEAETLESSLTEAVQAEGVEPGAAPAETPEEEPEAGGEEEAEEAEEPTAPVTGWAKDCCGSKIQKLQTVLEAVSTEIPQFTGKYRNLNLVSTGVQLIGQFFGQAQSLKDSFRALRKARNPQAALSALTELTNQVQQLRQTTKSAFQKQE